MRLITIAIVFVLSSTIVVAQKKAPAPTDPTRVLVEQRLKAEVERLSALSGGKLGVTAIHIESGRRFSQNATDLFPMASAFKVPIAVQLLSRIDSGYLSLDQLVEITREDMHPGSGMISGRFDWPANAKPGVALSVRSLMELMLLISDNSATDVCLRLAGGPDKVNACMKRLGIVGLRVDRPCSILIADYIGVTWPANTPWSNVLLDSLAKPITEEQSKAFSKKFDADPRDTSTPDAMANLLQLIYTKPILKEPSRLLLLDIMRRCESGLARLKGVLPPGTEVAHKTGTIGMTTNDVGIVTLPGNAGHLVVAAFVKSSEKEIPERERAIAEVTRVLHDYFALFYDEVKASVGAAK